MFGEWKCSLAANNWVPFGSRGNGGCRIDLGMEDGSLLRLAMARFPLVKGWKRELCYLYIYMC